MPERDIECRDGLGTAAAFEEAVRAYFEYSLDRYELDDEYIRYRVRFRAGRATPEVTVLPPPGLLARVAMPGHDGPMSDILKMDYGEWILFPPDHPGARVRSRQATRERSET